MLKKKTKSSKPSKLPIPRRAAATAKAEPAKAKPAKVKATEQAAPVPAPAAEVPAVEPVAAEPATASAEAPVAAPPPAAPSASKPAGKLSCLDAAAEVLKGAAEPMRCRELVDAMAAEGLWTSTAPTPHQTLASALLREVTRKGAASRFRKADRGRFALNAG